MKKNALLLDLDPRRGLPSAGSMYRLKRCPGSLALANWVKRHGYFVPQNPWAKPGKIIHQVQAVEVLGNNPKAIEEFRQKLSDDQWELAFNCSELRNWVINQWMHQAEDPDPSKFASIVERRIWYKLEELPKFSGQADLIAIDQTKRRALILDYKTGRLEAEPAADNMQLRTEAVLLKTAVPQLEEIQGAIIEPLVSWDSERVKYSGETFVQAEEEILEIVDAAAWHPRERHAGPWCAHCPGRVYCKEATRFIEQIPGFPAQNGERIDEEEGNSLANFDTEQMFRDLPRGERGSNLWRRIKFAEKLLDATITTYERILAQEPDALPGFVLPEIGRPRRQVTNPAKLKEALADLMTPEEVDGCADYSLSQIEKHYSIKAEVSKKAAEKLIADLTAEVTTITNDKPFIRPLTKAERQRIENGNPSI